VLLLDIAANREQWPELLERGQKFLEHFPESPQRAYARYRVGEAALQSGDLNRAATELKTLANLKDDPATNAEWYSSVYVLLAEAQYRAKDYDAVEQTIAEFRNRFPTSPLLYHADEILGRSYLKRAKLGEARQAFNKVIQSESGRRTKTAAKAQFNIAESWLIEKDYATALAEYYKVYVNYPIPEWQAPALFQAGQCDESQENWRDAAQSYEILIKEFPESEFAERARARLADLRARLE
jgi:cellulose synthase operon protein C